MSQDILLRAAALMESTCEDLNRIVCNLYRLFNEYDCTLAEINPLAVAG